MRRLVVGALAMSVLLNLLLLAALGHLILDGCAETNGRLGVLTRDVAVGRSQGTEALFTLPRGLVVRDASATGVGWFEPNRFRLVVTSDHVGLVEYGDMPERPHDGQGEYYSADIGTGRTVEPSTADEAR